MYIVILILMICNFSLTAVGIRFVDHATPSIRKSWHYLRRQAEVTRSL
jgi:hypothetical protein